MFFGRNEEEGLRCVYHGWKFDVTGACVDMPSEPAESNFKNKVHARAYKTHERGGIIWAYMGPREVPPPLPDIEANMLSTGPEHVAVLYRACNWMQGLEGEMDTVHAAFLHYGSARVEDEEPGSFNFFHYRERAARFVGVATHRAAIELRIVLSQVLLEPVVRDAERELLHQDERHDGRVKKPAREQRLRRFYTDDRSAVRARHLVLGDALDQHGEARRTVHELQALLEADALGRFLERPCP